MFLGITDPHPDPFVIGTDPSIRIRPKISRIPNTGYPDETKPEQSYRYLQYSVQYLNLFRLLDLEGVDLPASAPEVPPPPPHFRFSQNN